MVVGGLWWMEVVVNLDYIYGWEVSHGPMVYVIQVPSVPVVINGETLGCHTENMALHQ